MLRKPLLTIAFLLVAVPGWATDYYIKEDGSAVNKEVATSCDDAMSVATHNAETFSPGDTNYICNDGGDITSQITFPSSGTSGDNIVYDCQPPGQSERTIIDRNGGAGAGFYGTGKAFITIQNCVVREALTNGIHFVQTATPAVQGIVINNVDSLFNTNDGLFIEATSVLSTITNIRINNSNFDDNGKHGADIKGNWSDVIYDNCTADRNGGASAGHGFSSHPHASNATSGWTNTSGTIYSRSVGNDSVQKVIDRTSIAVLSKNDGQFASLSSGEWDQNGATLYINIGEDPAGKIITFKRGVTGGITYNSCSAEGNIASVAGEGHGIAFDDMSSDSTINNCILKNNEGAGVNNQWGDNNIVKNSLVYGNLLSGVRTTGYLDNMLVQNVTTNGNTGNGVLFSPPATNMSVKNVIATNNTLYGVSGSAGMAADISTTNLLAYGNNSGATNNTTDTDSTLLDPLFINPDLGDFGLKMPSPAFRTGTGTLWNGQPCSPGAIQQSVGVVGGSTYFGNYKLGDARNECTIPE